MSEMLTEISRVVNEDISNRVNQYDVIFEAVTNAIQANADKIICSLYSYDAPQDEENILKAERKLDYLTITDNGDGLNDENYESFCKYRSGFKQNLGGKGVGRFTFLKVYNKVKYKSCLKDKQEKRSFIFNLNFDTDNIETKPKKVNENLTEISLTSITKQYFDEKKHIDRRISLDIDKIKKKVLLNLIPTIFFYKKTKNRNIEIQFIDEIKNEIVKITHKDIPQFIEKTFEIIDRDGVSYLFRLYHKIINVNGDLNAFYCANNRTVCDFQTKDLKLNLPYDYSGFLLLESEYLNKQVNNERNDFDIFPRKTDLHSSISWEMINGELKNEVSEIVKEGIPETKKINKEKLQLIQEERPYLVQYIDEEDIEIAGFIDKKHIIEKAKKKFDDAKEKVLTNSGKEKYSDKELQDAIQLTQNELVAYIFDRVQVIERLKTMVNDKEKVEKVIHNLLMEKYTEDDYFNINKNNLWLLDDRYTSYSYAASDKRIIDVLKKGEIYDGDEESLDDRPDLSLYFSHPPSNKNGLKSVLIELKPFDDKSKSDKKKFAGIQQLLDYAEVFIEKEKVEEVWSFLITDVDEKLSKRLIRDSYSKLFSTNTPIYHRKYDNGISIYVVSAETLISDAEARNKMFLDIIRKQSKLSKMLNNE